MHDSHIKLGVFRLTSDRRKKCDSTLSSCFNCQRLGLVCERGTRLVWEDDARRQGMRRRGPPGRKAGVGAVKEAESSPVRTPSPDRPSTIFSFQSSPHMNEAPTNLSSKRTLLGDVRLLPQVSDWPFDLDLTDWKLLDRYIQLFSKTYPTCTDSTNPFLRVFIPLSKQSRPVLDAMLALSCVQSWEDGNFTMNIPMLRYRAKAIRGCRDIVIETMRKPRANQEIPLPFGAVDEDHTTRAAMTGSVHRDTQLLAICVLLMLYEKLSGECHENGVTHLQIFARIFPSHLFIALLDLLTHGPELGQPNEAILFLSNLFLYNDLVRSTSLRTSTLSNFYLNERANYQASTPNQEIVDRFYFPRIIAQIGANDSSVTDGDIAAWNGRLDWLPSFALQTPGGDKRYERLPTADYTFVYDPTYTDLESYTFVGSWDEPTLTSELYRVAATVYRKQRQPDNPDIGMGNLPSWAITMLRLIPPGSSYETALLWPVAIIAKELTQQQDREYVMHRLRMLEQRYKLKNYCIVREHFLEVWRKRDTGRPWGHLRTSLFG
ncbi:fungal-specific transcription factor domain-containing protein [Annulohypoxylon nitens]|nr:fungal-specific transcription factor domain-containing protein [Annulohypoxylon nitens]